MKPFNSVLAGMQEHQSECSQSACLGCTPLGKKYTKMGVCTNAAIGRRMQCSKDFLSDREFFDDTAKSTILLASWITAG